MQTRSVCLRSEARIETTGNAANAGRDVDHARLTFGLPQKWLKRIANDGYTCGIGIEGLDHLLPQGWRLGQSNGGIVDEYIQTTKLALDRLGSGSNAVIILTVNLKQLDCAAVLAGDFLHSSVAFLDGTGSQKHMESFFGAQLVDELIADAAIGSCNQNDGLVLGRHDESME